eukprot:scaffold246504_cov30-Tisochrysis_lutea.AAC.8
MREIGGKDAITSGFHPWCPIHRSERERLLAHVGINTPFNILAAHATLDHYFHAIVSFDTPTPTN